MRCTDLARWLETAREKEAVKVVVFRARKNGGNIGTFDELALKRLDVEALLRRMREDVTEARRLNAGVFELHALDKDGAALMQERITITREDEDTPIPDDPTVAATRIYLTETRAAFSEMRAMVRDGRDMMVAGNECLRQALESTNKQNADFMSKVGETLTMVFEMASLKKERDDAVQLSADRRAMWSKGIDELGPILGSALAKWSKKTGPAFLSFFNSLKPEQLESIMGTLSDEQRANLGTVVTMLQQDRKGA